MTTLHPALQFLLLTLTGWLNRQQQEVIDCLREENRVLRDQFGGRRLRLNDSQRRRLAAKGKALGRKLLGEIAGIVTPDTILRWYRRSVARKYDGTKSALGRSFHWVSGIRVRASSSSLGIIIPSVTTRGLAIG